MQCCGMRLGSRRGSLTGRTSLQTLRLRIRTLRTGELQRLSTLNQTATRTPSSLSSLSPSYVLTLLVISANTFMLIIELTYNSKSISVASLLRAFSTRMGFALGTALTTSASRPTTMMRILSFPTSGCLLGKVPRFGGICHDTGNDTDTNCVTGLVH